MGALCNFIPYLYHSTLISFSGLYLFSVFLCLSKQLYLSSYTVRIALLQCSHGYFSHKVENKNKIRQSWKIYREKYSRLSIYCSLPFIHLSFLHYTTIAKHCYLEKKTKFELLAQVVIPKIPSHVKFTKLDKTPNTTLHTIPIMPPNTPSKTALQHIINKRPVSNTQQAHFKRIRKDTVLYSFNDETS